VATEQRGVHLGTQLANADLRTSQFLAVKPINNSGTTEVALNTTSGGKILGVLQNKPNTGEPADVMIVGITKMVTGAAVTAGLPVMSDGAGKAIAAATTGSTIIGYALRSSGGAGEIIDVLVLPCVGVI
jgi:hypothetical protein